MNTTAKHKAYGGVLGIGLLALVLDRTLLDPDGAAAQSPAERYAVASDAAGEATPEVVSAPARHRSENSIGNQLQAIAEDRQLSVQQIPDAFAPADWQKTDRVERVDTPLEAEFRHQHRLNAVMASTSGGYAIVDGRRLKIGAKLDGFTLIEVTDGAAMFSAPGSADRVSLVMPGRE